MYTKEWKAELIQLMQQNIKNKKQTKPPKKQYISRTSHQFLSKFEENILKWKRKHK